MIDEEKRKKVIDILGACGTDDCDNCPLNGDERCSGFVDVPVEVLMDATTLLKEQEARVMMWDELMRCADGDPAFIEARDRSCCWVLIRPTYIGMIGKNGYGVRWRYWSARPSPEKMRETPWEG